MKKIECSSQRPQKTDFGNMWRKLETLLPDWSFASIGTQGAIACYPPKTNAENYRTLAQIAPISSVCGPYYVVTQLLTTK